MHRAIRALPAVVAAAALLPAIAFAHSAPGDGSYVGGRDSAGGYFGFGFDALTHGSYFNSTTPIVGAYMSGLSDTFNCTPKRGMPKYAFATSGPMSPKYPQGVIQPFPAVNDSYQSFHYIFPIKYQEVTQASTKMVLTNSKNAGTAVVSVSGRIKQISGPLGGPGKAIANGTIGIRVSNSCHTGTLTWTAKGSIVNPNAS